MIYQTFLAAKERRAQAVGVEASPGDIHPMLYPWQRESVLWALRTGRCALLWDCGLGKTFAQVEWARLSADTSLILAPLSVARQTVREARKIGVDVRYVRRQEDVTGPGVWITNYEMAQRFEASAFGAVVLDESSILKNVDGKTRTALIAQFRHIPRRLACTATPAPNDIAELTNHAEFLGVMSRAEMLAAYFINDEKDWRLKGHAAEPMFRWMATWSQAVRRPSDLGYPDEGWQLPPLRIVPEIVTVEMQAEGQLFPTDLGGVGGRAQVRKTTLDARVERVIELVTNSPGRCITYRDETRAAQGVHARLDQEESRAHSGVPGSDEGTAQRAQAGTVRAGRGAAEEDGCSRDSTAEGQPASTPSNALRTHGTAVGIHAGEGVCGVRSHSAETPHRPLPQDGQDTGRPMPAVQSGARPHRGRSEARPSPGVVSDPNAWVIWCGLNDEQKTLAEALGDRVISIHGALSPDEKERRLVAWLEGERPILLSKPSICGFGLNLQRAHKMAFVGLSDSYESYYQAIRRCWRFGQGEEVEAHIILSELEAPIAANVQRKEREADRMTDRLIYHMRRAREAA